MSRRLAPLALACLLLASSLAGCGDDSLTAQELHNRATVICARTAAATDRIVVPSTPSQGGRFLQQGLAHLRPAVAQLRDLKAPEELRDRYDRAVQLAGQEAALIARHERAIASGDDVIDTYRRLETALDPLVMQENAYWRGLQINACMRR
jgi:hypothetical protein